VRRLRPNMVIHLNYNLEEIIESSEQKRAKGNGDLLDVQDQFDATLSRTKAIIDVAIGGLLDRIENKPGGLSEGTILDLLSQAEVNLCSLEELNEQIPDFLNRIILQQRT